MAQPSDMIVYDNAVRPSTQRSVVRKYADMLTLGNVTPLLRSAERHVGVGPVAATLHSIRGNGEAGMTGLGLGFVSGAGGLDRDGIPVDLATSAFATLMGILFSSHEAGITLRQVGSSAMAVFTFRKTEEWLGVRKKASFAGDVVETTGYGVDPIMEAAKAL